MKILNTRILKKGVITLSFLCYLITCGFVPYYYDEATNLCYGDGLFNLFFGWFCFVFPGIFTKIYSLAWFSNITYIVAIRHLIKGNRKHFVLWICITIILSSLLIICPRTETDTWGNIHHFTLTIGYYLRIISFFILFVGGIYVLFKQNSTKELSPNHIGKYSLDNQGYVVLQGQIIKDIKHIQKFTKCNFSNSSFMTSNIIYWIKNKSFIDSIFSKTSFNALAEHGNKFHNCIFEYINFKSAILGYDSSLYTNCTFKRVKFGVFIKPQFKDCKFIDCDFYNVDFQASSFEHCEFIGKLENVWFRGGFPTDSLKKEFGCAQQNKMLNVSFENAILHDITFSDNCDLSTIILPKYGRYLFFDNWNEQLNMILKKGKTNQLARTSNDIISFVAIYKIHSTNQKYYILNIEDLLREYSEKAVEIIQQNATQESDSLSTKKRTFINDKKCRVCGYELAYFPWGENNDTPSYEICPCCGAEFGCDDYTPEAIKVYREKWIKSGAKWFNPNMMPTNWSLEKQLYNYKKI